MNEVKVDGVITHLSSKVVGEDFFIGDVVVRNTERGKDREFIQHPVLQCQGDKGRDLYAKLRVGNEVTCTGSVKAKEGSKFTNVAIWKVEIHNQGTQGGGPMGGQGYTGGPVGGAAPYDGGPDEGGFQ